MLHKLNNAGWKLVEIKHLQYEGREVVSLFVGILFNGILMGDYAMFTG